MLKAEKLAFLMASVFFVVYAVMGVNDLYKFEVMGWDMAIFDQGVWNWSRIRFPFSSFHDIWWLGDHFHLILAALAPLYWIWAHPAALIVAQAFLVCFGGLTLYLLALEVTKSRKVSLALYFAYLTYFPLQWHMFSGFHEMAFLPLCLGGALYFLHMKKWRAYWVFVALSHLIKEDVGLLIAAVGVWMVVADRKNWKAGVVTFLVGAVYSMLVIGIIMPALSSGQYRHLGYGKMGENLVDVAVNVVRDPGVLVSGFTDSSVKLKTMLISFLPFGFLPFASLASLVPIYVSFAVRFFDYGKEIRWTPYFAYSIPAAVLIFWGSLQGVGAILRRRRSFGWLVALVVVALSVGQNYVLHAPIHSIVKRGYFGKTAWMSDNHKVIDCVPDGVSVSAQNSLAPWLSRREKIKIFPEGLGYDYVVLDLHAGQSENSFHFLGSEKTKYIYEDLIENGYYEEVCRYNSAVALRKTGKEIKLNYPFEIEIYEK